MALSLVARRRGGPRLPGAIELPWARRRRLRAERGTVVLGVAAFGLTLAVLGTEIARTVRARMDAHPELDSLESAELAVRETVEVAVAGIESLSPRETAMLNLLASFSLTFACARAGTFLIRHRGPTGPFRDLVVGERHIHHFVPGIVLAFLAGGASVLSRNEELDSLLAVPFGAGVALTLDESALLLRLDDVYWSEDGIISVQITLAALALLSSTTLVRRALRRGARRVALRGAAAVAMPPPQAAAARPASR
ncbi:MAG TPA: hypothetical protein VNA28_15770 [Solirubrobacteraceae bacterium]|nr:hypothetical protein [Solirubrobacteraceae bacterium]